MPAVSSPEQEWYRPKEIAAKLGYAPSTVRRWIRTKKLRARGHSPQGPLVHADDLAAFLDEVEQEPDGE